MSRGTGERIRRAREELGLSQDALAEQVGVSGMMIHLYETGVADPANSLSAIAEATARPLTWFLERDDVAATVEAAEPEPEPAEPEPAEPESEPEPEPEPAEPEPKPEPPDQLDRRAAQLEERAAALAAEEQRLERLAAELAQRELSLGAEQQRLERLATELDEGAARPAPGASEPAEERAAEPVTAEEPEPAPAGAGPSPSTAERERAPLVSIVRVQPIGGSCLIVDTEDGRQVRVTASLDEHSRQFVSAYELRGAESWQGKVLSVWEPTREYRQRVEATMEACLEAALAEIDAGPRPPEPEPEAEPEPAAEPEAEQVEAPRRRRFLPFGRRG